MDGSRVTGAVARETPRTAYFMLWGSALLFVLALSMKAIGVGLMEFEGPMGKGLFYLRSLLSLAIGGMFISGVVMTNRSRRELTATFSSQTSIWAVLALSTFFTLVLAYDRQQFLDWAYEDSLVETLSAVFSVIASLVFVVIFIELFRAGARPRLVYLGTAAMMALLLFVAGMEEVSWMQRLLSVDAPDAFNSNLQGEINLHNFDTLIMNVIFYTASFLLLIFAPFIEDQTRLLKRLGQGRFFVPGLTVLLISSVSVFYNYKLWDTLFLQLILFTTMFILAYYAIYSRGSLRLLVLGILSIGIATQLLLLSNGYSFGIYWLGSEYREFFIPIGFLVYSLELLRRARFMRRRGLVHLPGDDGRTS